MNRHIPKAIAILALAAGAASVFILVVPGPQPASAGPLTFDDEFSGAAVNTSLWLVNSSAPKATGDNGELECYRPANVTEGGGVLNETAKVDSSCAGFSYTSGAIQSHYRFTYGTVAVRAKLAGGTGPWPAIWLLGANCQPWRMGTGCHPAWPQPGSDEIDIAETLNSNHSAINEQVHAIAGSPGCMPSVADASRNWHIYTLVWAPGSLVWQIDGATTCRVNGATVPSHPMFLIINTAVGGTGGGGVNSGTLPQATSMDYARISAQGATAPPPAARPAAPHSPTPTPTPRQSPSPTPSPSSSAHTGPSAGATGGSGDPPRHTSNILTPVRETLAGAALLIVGVIALVGYLWIRRSGRWGGQPRA